MKKEFQYKLEGTTLVSYIPQFFGLRWEEFERVDLTLVKHIDYYVSPFSKENTIRMTLWTGNPELQFDTTFLERSPANRKAKELGFVRAPDFVGTPEHSEFIAYFAPRIESGAVSSSLDLNMFIPLPSR